jgi:hypothetical protein
MVLIAITSIYIVLSIHLQTAPEDYVEVPTMTITFPAGVIVVTIPVTTTNDDVAELPERFTGVLSNPTGGLILGDDDMATININDDDGELGQSVI